MAQKNLFALGQIVATPGAIDLLKEKGKTPLDYLIPHQKGDWGAVGLDDQAANEYAVKSGERIFSVYDVGGEKLWVITEWDRSLTTLLLPSEY